MSSAPTDKELLSQSFLKTQTPGKRILNHEHFKEDSKSLGKTGYHLKIAKTSQVVIN